LVLGVSFSDEKSIYEFGYKAIPRQFSLAAYQYLFKSPQSILDAYGITIFVTIVGTVISTLVISLYAYAISRREFAFRKFFTVLILITMLFNGGMVPWYIVCVRVLHIQDSIFALILPYLINGWYIIIMRTFFKTTIPDSVIESAKLDGAGEFRTYFKIVLPLSLPGLATVALFTTLGYWNDWWLPLMLINDSKLYNLQYLIYIIMNNIQFLQTMAERGNILLVDIPSESARMAMCIITIGPILIAYPFFQRFFIKGLTIGAIKG
jgi:putative aldouronate transport system permease protein